MLQAHNERDPVGMPAGFFMKKKAELMSSEEVKRALKRMAHEIAERNNGAESVVILGIVNGGIPIAEELAVLLGEFEGIKVPLGTLDISHFRDDLAKAEDGTKIYLTESSETHLPCSIEGKDVVLVDDVLYTGRTARAAFDALSDRGRAGTIQLAVLVDRGHRELPIRADYVGKNVPTSHNEKIGVETVDGGKGIIVNIYDL